MVLKTRRILDEFLLVPKNLRITTGSVALHDQDIIAAMATREDLPDPGGPEITNGCSLASFSVM